MNEEKIIDDFHALYYSKEFTWRSLWLGVTIAKTPFDLWTYQEIIFQTRPTLIIECGSFTGGSALYFASIFDLLGQGRVISIELETPINPIARAHKRIEFIKGSSTDSTIYNKVAGSIKPSDKVMVSLDSSHESFHVLQEMKLYGNLVSLGNYMVVEDGNIHHPINIPHGPGPYEAIEEFLKINDRFGIDKSRERFLMTFNPNGYLKRVK